MRSLGPELRNSRFPAGNARCQCPALPLKSRQTQRLRTKRTGLLSSVKSSREYDYPGPGLERAEYPARDSGCGSRRQYSFDVGGRADDHHSYTHVERSVHLSGFDRPRFLQYPKNTWYFPAGCLDYGIKTLWQRSIHILRQSAARYVRHRVNAIEHRFERRQVRPMFREKNVCDRPTPPRKCIVRPEPQTILYDLPRQRVSIRVQSRAWKTYQNIAGPHAVWAKNTVFLHISDDEARQIVIRGDIQAGHFSRFPAY